MFSLDGIEKRYGRTEVLKGVSLELKEGEVVALLGPSGSGKSTLLRIAAGLEAPDRGQVRFRGRDVTRLPPKARGVGIVFQHYALFPHLTVFENVAFGLRVRRAPEGEVRRRVGELLELVRLLAYADRFPDELSGGQRQRVALARALAVDPEVLLLDEPFSALDPEVRLELRRFLRALVEEIGVAALLVTHDQEEALEVADRVAVLHEGRLEQIGTPEELYEAPRTPFVARFVGRGYELLGRIVRPHEVQVAREGDGVPARVLKAVPQGSRRRLLLLLEDGRVVEAEGEGRAGERVLLRPRTPTPQAGPWAGPGPAR